MAYVGFEGISVNRPVAWYEQPANPTALWAEHAIGTAVGRSVATKNQRAATNSNKLVTSFMLTPLPQHAGICRRVRWASRPGGLVILLGIDAIDQARRCQLPHSPRLFYPQ